MAEIMEQALDIALDKKDLKRKRARRLDREGKRHGETPKEKSRPDKIFVGDRKATSRYIPLTIAVRGRAPSELVWRRPKLMVLVTFLLKCQAPDKNRKNVSFRNSTAVSS